MTGTTRDERCTKEHETHSTKSTNDSPAYKKDSKKEIHRSKNSKKPNEPYTQHEAAESKPVQAGDGRWVNDQI